MLPAIAAREVHTLGVGIHNFMGSATVATADRDPVIRARLDSCVFKGAVKESGEWVAVPMCKMNEAHGLKCATAASLIPRCVASRK